MKNVIQILSGKNFICLICWVALAGPAFLSAQPAITVSMSGCTTVINTSIPSSTLNSRTEPSTGFFYRLDGVDGSSNSLGSYFWKDAIALPSTGTPPTTLNTIKNLLLPTGDYELVCYQTRKGGPIKNIRVPVPITVPLSCGITEMPTVPVDTIRLETSWNVCTFSKFFDPAETHHTKITDEPTLAEPWFFVTLSVYNWPTSTPVKVTFDATVLSYEGAIADNHYDTYATSWDFLNAPVHTTTSNYVTIYDNGNVPPNKETHIHLIFQQKNPGLANRSTVTFTAEIGNTVRSISPLVSGTPHDPNSLTVDKDQLCRCQKNEILTYQVDFQNKGTDIAEDVDVQLGNTTYLDLGSIAALNPAGTIVTDVRRIPVVFDNIDQFLINQIHLPGTQQLRPQNIPEEQTRDRFTFRIRKADCLRAGDMIYPQASIVFRTGIGQDPVYTDYEKTEIVSSISTQEGVKSCKTPDPSCTGCTRKRCWLRDLYCKK